MKIESMLIVINPQQPVPLMLEKVFRLAAAFKPRIELFICDTETLLRGPDHSAAAAEQGLAKMRTERIAALEALAAALRGAGHQVKVDALRFAPLHEGIVRHVLKRKPDLVIKEHQESITLARAARIPTDHYLARDCPAPLLLLQPGAWSLSPQVVSAIDPCHPADRAAELDMAVLAAGEALSSSLGAAHQCVHALQGPSHLVDEPPDQVAIAAQHQQNRQIVERFFDRHAKGHATLHFLESHPRQALIEFVKARACDILVMGAVARSRPHDPLIGGTAAAVLDAVSCDVLIIKSPGFISPVLIADEI